MSNMNEYRFQGSRKSDGAPVSSRMLAENEERLKQDLADYGIVLESAELLKPPSRSQTASLGCGTLFLIAIDRDDRQSWQRPIAN